MSASAPSAPLPNIRRAAAADLDALAALGVSLARQHLAYDARRFQVPREPLETAQREFFAALLADDATIMLLAESGTDGVPSPAIGRRALGYAFLRLEPASQLELLPPSGWVHDLFVSPEARGLGLGSALLDASIAALRDAGATLVMLTVAARNPEARRLFERRGFAVTMHEMALPLKANG